MSSNYHVYINAVYEYFVSNLYMCYNPKPVLENSTKIIFLSTEFKYIDKTECAPPPPLIFLIFLLLSEYTDDMTIDS